MRKHFCLFLLASIFYSYATLAQNASAKNPVVHADVPEAMEYQLPPLTLQLLVENVIKHNSINSNKPMDITIQIVDHFLVVSNPIHAKKSDTTSGVGLQNLSNRCKLMIGTDIIINNENQIFTVKVPLIYE